LHAVRKLDRWRNDTCNTPMPSSTRSVTAASAAKAVKGSRVGRPRPIESPTQMPGKPLASMRRA